MKREIIAVLAAAAVAVTFGDAVGRPGGGAGLKQAAQTGAGGAMKEAAFTKVSDAAGGALGAADAERLGRGLDAVLQLWRPEDGGAGEFAEFAAGHFVPSGDRLEKLFKRFEANFESINGHMLIISRDISRPIQLDTGEPLAVDYMFAEYSPAAHVLDDLFKNRIAFAAILNFPPAGLEEKLSAGPVWDRRTWARAKLAEGFRDRVPADVLQRVGEVFTRVDNYINEYNIFMGKVVDADLKPLFPEGLKLITHWGLRDELKGQYAKDDPLPRQEAVYSVMKRIIDGTIPVEAINKGDYLWNPASNSLFDAKTRAGARSAGGEDLERYSRLKQVYEAETLVDRHVPSLPTHIMRRFERDRQIPEAEVERLLVAVLEAPEVSATASLVSRRLGRALRPFDIWYNGFKQGKGVDEDELDRMVRKKYPAIAAFQKDIPEILKKLGFGAADAKYLAAHIEVDPSRGAGHAMGAETRSDKAHLRTRAAAGGMNYKGFNIAMHELGHCVEQVLTLNRMDYYSLRGVPNTAFTESYAFMFQARDLEVLGAGSGDPERELLAAMNDFWMTYEISGVSIVDMRVWRWMYQKREFSAAELRDAVISIAKEVWNRYYAPVFGLKDEPILAVYSHMINSALYLPDYPIGHLINFQIEEYVKGKNLASEMMRMVSAGSITPSMWMKAATGAPLSAEPLVKAAAAALKGLSKDEAK